MSSLKDRGFGITAAGFKRPNLSDLISRTEELLQQADAFGPDFSFEVDKVLYQVVSSLLMPQVEQFEIIEEVFNNATPLKAEGNSLFRFGSFIGKTRKQASFAEAQVTFTGTAGTQIPSGQQVKTTNDIIFYVKDGGTITATSLTLTVVAEIAGSSGNVGANTITELVTPLPGITNITNTSAATKGQDQETEVQFRTSYFDALDESGGLNVDGIASKLKALSGVTDAIVIENDTSSTVDGIPPKSIAAFVIGGSDNDIAQELFNSKPGGIQAYGIISIQITDTQGINHTIGFSRPTALNIWVKATITKNSAYPGDGDTAIKNAIISYINNLGLSKTVYPYQITSMISDLGIQGIDNILIELSTDGITYSNTHITVDKTKYAQTDTNKVAII